MEISEIIGVAAFILTYSTALIGIYINMKLKIKEIDIKMQSIEKDLSSFKKSTQDDFKKFIEKHELEHNVFSNKLDILLEKFYELKNELVKKH